MRSSHAGPGVLLAAVLLAAAGASPLAAQGTGGIQGTVTRSDDGSPLAGVMIRVVGTQVTTTTSPAGRYTLQRIPAGQHVIRFTWVGYAPREVPATITAGGMVTVDAALEPLPVQLAELMVSGASRAPERVTEAPSAITQVDPRTLQTVSVTGSAPLALRNVPGVDLAQSGVTDFNVNARGFNSTLNRRVLTLQDGRDLAIAFLGSQEWNTLSLPTEDFTKMEFVSGPGSALYGANAFSGVLDITTPTAREARGTKLTLGGGAIGGPAGGWEGGSPGVFRGDLRHAAVFGEGRFGYRLNVGMSRSDTWSRSRTLRDSTALQREYADATDSLVPRQRAEARPLLGQTADPATGVPQGDRDPVKTAYGSARFDYYAADGSVGTVEGGFASVENEVFVTGIGRVQVTGASRPWARANWAANRFNLMAYWNGRRTGDPQYSLSSGAPLLERSDIFHVEGQGNTSLAGGRVKLVYGASARSIRLDTDTTLMIGRDDDRSDSYYAGFGQFSWEVSDKLRLLLAGRVDGGNLIDVQVSPKAALVFTPTESHSIRFTVNRAFQTPNYSEYFLRAAAGVANLALLEAGLRASPLGPALAGVPNGQLFACEPVGASCAATSSAVPAVARGNGTLDVETNTGYEVGYRGDLSRRLSVSVDAYYNRLGNFVTDLLPGVNPAFPFWTAPSAVPEPFRAPLEGAVQSALLANPASRTAGLGLTRQENGGTAIVLSYANAGSATQWGTDIGLGWQLTDELLANASFSWFDYDVETEEIAAGDQLLANTPEFRYTGALSYAGRQGLDLGASFRASSGFPWAAGVFAGWVEPGFTVDANAGYRVSNNFKVFMAANNVLNKQWFSVYGGSVTGRRVMGGVTATF